MMGLQYCVILLLIPLCGANFDINSGLNNHVMSKDQRVPTFAVSPLRYHDTVILNDTTDPYHKQPHKRGLAAVLIGATVVMSLVNVGTDVWFAHGGCCKVNEISTKDACDKVTNIDNMRKQLADLGTQMDNIYLLSQMDMTYIQDINNKNELLRIEIERLRDLETDIIYTMDPQLTNKFLQVADDIKQKWKDGKEDIANFGPEQQIELYSPMYATWKGRAKLFSGVGLHVLGELGAAMKRRIDIRYGKDLDPTQKSKMVTQLNAESLKQNSKASTTKFKNMMQGADKMDDVANRMVRAKTGLEGVKTKSATTSHKISKGFGFLAVAAEIVSLFMTVKACVDRFKEVEALETKTKDIVAESKTLLAEIEDNRNVLRDQYKLMKDGLKGENFTDVISHFRNFIQESAPAARLRMREAERDINVFLNYIDISNPSLSSSLQVILINGLKKITIKYKCLYIRVETQAAIASSCKLGSSTMEELYNLKAKEKKLTDCVTEEGEPFTTFEQMKGFIEIDSTNDTDPANHYNPVCRLNNEPLVAGFCTMKCEQGYTYAEILKDYPEITEDMVMALCEPCPFTDLTPDNQNYICDKKTQGKDRDWVVATLLEFGNYDPAKVKAHYDTC